MSKIIFDIGRDGRGSYSFPKSEFSSKDIAAVIPSQFLRKKKARLPELTENEVVRHYIGLSLLNYHVDKGFYPLGSCTMKYNPKINDKLSNLNGFSQLHPFQPEKMSQSALQILFELSSYLSEISGMAAVSLQPAAGAQGEFAGIKIIRAYHEHRGNRRHKILIPDSAHGTNPASVTLAGYESVKVNSNEFGLIDIEDLKTKLDQDTAALMVTNPNTLGLFEVNIKEIINLVHSTGALIYMDGANLNALLGIVRPGEIGFDVMHFNLHKTFSTPHGGGGPGAGPIGVAAQLVDFLPVPVINKDNNQYKFDYDRPLSIGKVSDFYGNFAIILRAYIYIRMLGEAGLTKVSENAIINANYVMKQLEKYYLLPHAGPAMHEFVISAKWQKEKGVKALDIAKNLLDFGFHAPTIYFPLIVPEALMIEPTETESKESLDAFIDAMIQIAKKTNEDPEAVKNTPKTTVVSRLDEVRAIKNPNIKYNFDIQ
jgi:glycine dehydrogenase subunit 2